MVLIQKTKLGCHFWGGAGSAPGLGINNQVTLPATWRCRVIFSENEFLTPSAIDQINSCSRLYFFESQPFVILSACETGTAGTRSADNNGFVGALMRTGVRALFVTEAPVWANFAQHFSQDLIDEILAGKEAQTALLATRRKHLAEWKNPLGLIYTLYGNQGAKVKK